MRRQSLGLLMGMATLLAMSSGAAWADGLQDGPRPARAADPPLVTATFGSPSVLYNASTPLKFYIKNPPTNAVPLSGIAFNSTLPPGLKVLASSRSVCGGGSLQTTKPSGIQLSGVTLAGGATCQFSVDIFGEVAGTQSMTTSTIASAEAGHPGSPAGAELDVYAVPPTLAISFSPATVTAGATSNLSIVVGNPHANPIPMFGIAVSGTLPAGLSVANTSRAICSGTLTTTAPRTIRFTGFGVPTNSTCGVTVTVKGASAGNYTAALTVTVDGWSFSGNRSTAGLRVAAVPAPPTPTPTPAPVSPVQTDAATESPAGTPADAASSPSATPADPAAAVTNAAQPTPAAGAAPTGSSGGDLSAPLLIVVGVLFGLAIAGLAAVLFGRRKSRPGPPDPSGPPPAA